MRKTVAAITTMLGEGGIGVVQISGHNALYIVNKIFKCKKVDDLHKAQSHSLFYGTIHDNGTTIDEAVINVYQKEQNLQEEMVEINCHGGVFLVKKILDLVVTNGASKTNWQEHIDRFISSHHLSHNNQSFDLIQKEALQLIPLVKTKLGAKVMLAQYSGALSVVISDMIRKTDSLIGDTDTASLFNGNRDKIVSISSSIAVTLKHLLISASFGLSITKPQKIVIIGKPNSGKSALTNKLLGKDRVIVHHEPGTTRDAVSELISIKGVPFELIDTAGIRETEHEIEQKGINLTADLVLRADKLIILFDSSKPVEDEDRELFNFIRSSTISNKNVLCSSTFTLLSKTDLPQKIDITTLFQLFKKNRDINRIFNKISSITGFGIKELEDQIVSEFSEYINYRCGTPVIFNHRQLSLLSEANDIVNKIVSIFSNNNHVISGSNAVVSDLQNHLKTTLMNCLNFHTKKRT